MNQDLKATNIKTSKKKKTSINHLLCIDDPKLNDAKRDQTELPFPEYCKNIPWEHENVVRTG